jgi:hypothetical protein
MDRRTKKGLIAGAAAGMVASWAANRFYTLARESTRTNTVAPYLAGAGIGAAYGFLIQRRRFPMVTRVPLIAAIWLGEPERTAAPVKGGRDMPERARNIALRMAARRLKEAAEKALLA